MERDLVKVSRFISLVLRHEPSRIGLVLDPNGWASVDELISKAMAHGVAIDRAMLIRIVTENDKRRFAVNEDGSRIRARQGHSIDVDLGLAAMVPPERLFHGTAASNLASIRASGLHGGGRQHVHLSLDRETAVKVGARHGRPIVLTVASGEMHAAGHDFYRSENGVWLTGAVPTEYIEFPVD